MNDFQAAVLRRLRAANLIDVAERAAKRVDLRLADCIAPGAVTGGHRALWLALAAFRSPTQVAALVGFPEEAIVSEFRDAPEPKSGPRVRKTEPARDAILDRIRVLEERLAVTPEGRSLKERLAILEQRVGGLIARVDALTARDNTDAEPTRIAAEVADAHGITVQALVGRSRTAALVRARSALIRRLVDELHMPEIAIGRFLWRDHSTIRHYLYGSRGKAAA